MTTQENHRFKLVIFDLDGTFTQERSIWESIHIRLGKWYGFAEEYHQQIILEQVKEGTDSPVESGWFTTKPKMA